VKNPRNQLDMSASPQPTQSAKRPLEETSSPSVADQPEAKRPALDKVIKDEEEIQQPIAASTGQAATTAQVQASEANGAAKTNGEKSEVKDAQGDTVVPDAPETKPIASTASGSASQGQANPPPASHDETAWIHIRAVISSPEAATVIGKGGENVSKIRQMSGAKCTVSDYQKGAVERILTVSGIVDAVAKVWPACFCPVVSPHELTPCAGLRFDH
jgi:poly(rC)-binding protein 2/3/4